MKRGITFLLLGILIIGGFFAQQKISFHLNISGDVVKAVENGENARVMIKLKDSVAGKRGISSDVKKEINTNIQIKNEFKNKVSAIINKSELDSLKKNPNIESIEIIKTRSIALQDSVPQINASSAWNLKEKNYNLTGKEQSICIIDTGVDYTHSDLGGCYGNNDVSSNCKVIGGWDYCADNVNCTTEDSDPMDESSGYAEGHGTHVSGIVSANGSIKGVAPGAKIIMIKASNSSGTFWDDDIEKAIDWCINNASKFNISVISMSLGGGLYSNYCNDDPLASSINNAVSNNISVVIAAGNDGSITQISAPACIETAIPVGSIRKDDSSFDYNRNSLVELITPGYSINSTKKGGNYITMSGTSMATPHAAGAIAIINQFLKSENKTKTPSEIENALNNSGKRIYDSGSGVYYSRIDIYSTIINIDEFAPEIKMNYPENNLISLSQNISFNCSAEDLQLNNLTFYLWNSSNYLINKTNMNATDNFLEINLNFTLENGTYKWACESYDEKLNYNISSNYSLRIGEMNSSLISPSDNYYTNNNEINFTCDINDSTANLTNMTLMLWNSEDILIYNKTKEISGKSNQSSFNYSLVNETNYEWNCYSYDENSNLIFADSNYTLIYDKTSPIVTLISPSDNSEEDSGTINFKYNVSDVNEIKNCSLIIDSDTEKTDSSIQRNHTETISTSLSSGSYEWKIKCIDIAENSKTSSRWDLDIASSNTSDTSEDTTDTSEEETPTQSTFILSEEEIKKGTSKLMKKQDLMKFNFKNKSHTLEVDNLTEKEAKIIISSDPLTIILKIGESKKVNINGDKTYDLEVTYNEYKNAKANISIKEINESIPTRQIQTGNQSSNETSKEGNSITGKSVIGGFIGFLKKNKIIIYIFLGVVGLAVAGLVIHKKRERIIEFLARIKKKSQKKKRKTYKDI